MVGDLALCGHDIHGHIVAYRSGHRLNAELVRVLLVEGRRLADRRRTA
jgi:UDP-3-O-acyl-N-acetylglucosamine deacetylase